ncbi:SDR family NAD(P)-dependent oxidoreductase [Streptomyces sparsogenes]|uniref:SDR family NAD(P)-dependent oxidoreductase n=1 Tax=Streptomyces sparsogenes TaxID=67365 RepID=UPI0033CFE055
MNEQKLVDYLRRVTTELHDTRQRLREAEDRHHEPVAIVDMACRYPGGVETPEDLWDLVRSRREAMGPFPQDRGWDLDRLVHPDPDHPGTSYADRGGFLDDVAGFDPDFFGISHREALVMDPQQRLLLEVAWEVLERAGIDPLRLKGSPTGVYVGAALPGFDAAHSDSAAEGYLVTGNAPSVLSGRLSYTLGLEGPAVMLDTACSSSLVAIHLACHALRQGECTLALAGGVTVMAQPGVFTEFSRQRGLAADGTCKPFSAAADGTAFSEGVGMLLLERLSDARRNGHRVLALVRGSAVNQDGASNGLTAPNGPSQQRAIRQALDNARLVSAEVDAVEAHGTGTRLGDPIEAQALLATYGQDRPADKPLWLGSVKSNIGHTQGGAGVAGVIKTVMALRHETLPPTLHADEPTPHVDWTSGAVKLLTEPVAWPRGEHVRRAGVSSFGISGTNAHLILEQSPESVEPTESTESAESAESPESIEFPEPPETVEPATVGFTSPVAWTLSARSRPALRAQAGALAAHLAERPGLAATDVAWSLARTRSVFEHRAVLWGTGPDRLTDALAALEADAPHPALIRGDGPADTGGTALLFTGQGSQRPGMGRQLYRTYEAFARGFDEICALLDPLLGRSLRALVFDEQDATDPADLHQTRFTQAALFAVETALFRLVESFGLTPTHVIGHSIGQITAAHASGVLSLPDACTLVAARGRLMQTLPTGGAMAAVEAPEDRVLPLLARAGGRVALAAVNGPASVVVSGDADAVTEIAHSLRDQGHRTKRLQVSHAFHSPHMDPMLEEFRAVAARLDYRPPRIPTVCNLTGHLADAAGLSDPDYWVRHVRDAVRFHDGIRTLHAEGVTRYLELGPDPVLTAMAETGLADAAWQPGTAPLFATVLRKDRDEPHTLLSALAAAHVHGATVDFSTALPADAGRVPLPTYRFQRRRYWRPAPQNSGHAPGQRALGHPLAGSIVDQADGGLLLTGRLSRRTHGWLADHAIADSVPLPGTAFLELALTAARAAGCGMVEDLTVEAPLLLPAAGAVDLQAVVGPADPAGRRTVTVYSRASATPHGTDTLHPADPTAEPWHRHAAGTLAQDTQPVPEPGPAAAAWPPPGATEIDGQDLYDALADQGYRYGPAFRGVRTLWRQGETLHADVHLAAGNDGDAAAYGLHPALLDAALHPVDELYRDQPGPDGVTDAVRLPFSYRDVRLHAAGAVRLRVSITSSGQDAIALELAGEDGTPVASIGSLGLRVVSAAQWRSSQAAADDTAARSLRRVTWQLLPAPEETDAPRADGHWAVLASGAPGQAADPAWAPVSVHPDLATLRAAVPSEHPAPDLVLAPFLPADLGDSAEEPEPHRRAGALAHRLLRLLRQWLADPSPTTARLAVLTRNAVATGPADPPADLTTAPLWGMVRAAQAEHPGRILLVDTDGTDASHRALRTAVPAALAAGETECALRDGHITVPRLTEVPVDPDTAAPALDLQGTVLITGGTGALGRVAARHLVTRHGARHLLLAGRRGETAEGSAELAAELTDLGAHVRFARCDTSDPQAVTRLLADIPAEHPLTAVVHTAGIIDDALVSTLTPQQLDAVMAAKAAGAWLLHQATRGMDLAAFVLYSSAASVLGNAGQANYAAANAFVNALAEHRHARGLPGLSLAWGMWEATGGMAGQLADAERARITRLGIAPLTPAQGLALLDRALAAGHPTPVPVRLDRAVLRDLATAGSLPPLLRTAAGVRPRPAARPAATSLADRLARLPEAEHDRVLRAVVREQTATVLAHPDPDALDLTRAFQDLGLDSLTALELRNRLGAATGTTLPASLVFDHPTPEVLVRFLHGRLAPRPATTTPRHGTTPTAAPTDEPLAVIGMACRYPGGITSPQGLWDLVAEGRDAIGAFPTGRGWNLAELFHPDPDHPGTSYACEGGFLHDADEFDADFFGISPREAVAMDPQQRLLLETAWQTFESAGLDPAALRGSPTAVVTGVMYDDYGSRFLGRAPKGVEGRLMPGSTPSVASGRVSYTFGLEGPAMTVDTACSSSLVAIHLAAQALRQGECSLALAGGVTVMATPNTFVEFSRQRGVSADGRCKAFSAAADGTGWSEGVGLVLLERLSDARRNGHPVLAVLRGSAVNQDGASNGLTAPNGPSQERVIRQALAQAGLSPAEVDAVEAHGTGTRLGDPIEAGALLAAYGQDRPAERPLWLGSVKSNIGHTQAAAGVAGVIKMVMAMRHGVLPATLHIDEPSPHVDWDSGAVSLLTERTAWPTTDHPRRAGVSSFGFSGTNAHIILEQAPQPAATAAEDGTDGAADETPDGVAGIVPWAVSARGPQALRGQAAALAAHVAADPHTSAPGVGWSLAATRSVFEHRAVVIGEDRAALLAGLEELAAGRPHPSVITARAPAAPAGRTVFLFSGQGSQRVGMGAGLYARFPVFAAAFDEVCAELDGHMEHPLRRVVFEGVPEGLLDHTSYTQAGLFAFHIALARLVESFGIRPDAVVGHSIGEIAAAQLAGVFDLPDACRLVAARATLMGGLPGGGAMTAIEAGAEELAEDLAARGGRVSIAAVNTPTSTVISGPAEDVAALGASWAAKGRKTKALTVSHAFHSPLMEPMLDRFQQAISGLTFHRPTLPLISNLTGRPAGEDIATPAYWARHIRRTVHFASAITHLAPDTAAFLELGPDPVLATAAQRTLEHGPGDGPEPLVTASLTRKQPEVRAFAQALARLHTHGVDIDWKGWFANGPAPRTVPLPTYAFQRERYWLEGEGGAGSDPEGMGLASSGHPLLGAALELAGEDTRVLTGRLTAGRAGWPADHRIGDTVLVPGAALVEWALRAADETGCGGVEELVLQAPLVLPPDGGVRVQVVVDPAGADRRREVRVYSRPDRVDPTPGGADDRWLCHAEGTLSPHRTGEDATLTGAWPPPGAQALDVEDFYARTQAAGYGYGPAFQGLRAAWRDGTDLLAEVELPRAAGDTDGFGVHPALLDAALHPLFLLGRSGQDQVWLPFSWGDVTLHAVGARTVRVRLSPHGERLDQGVRLTVVDPAGAPVLTAASVAMRPVRPDEMSAARTRRVDGLYRVEWTALPQATGGSAAPDTLTDDAWAVLGDRRSPAGSATGAADFTDVTALVGAIEAGAAAPSAALATVTTPGGGDSADGALARATQTLELLRAWLAEPRLAGTRLVVATRAAAAVDGEVPNPSAAAVWGLVRTAQRENPDQFVLLDLGPDTTGPDADTARVTVDDEIRHAVACALASDEPQLALRRGRVLVPRLMRAGGALVPPDQGAWRLGLRTTGSVAGLDIVTAPEAEAPLEPGQVRLAVRAAGVNFRDVLIALGMYPDDADFGGSEGAGTVTAVGPGVSGLAVGDRVMGLFEGAFGPVAVADARMLVPLPDGWQDVQGASVPVTFLTAWFGLTDLGRLRPGESVLIHAATGGVGTAAVQIARHLGAEVFATAGPGKQHVLAAMGIDAAHRASSRDLDFKGAFRRATGGRGVDVVLNSLAGEFTDASLRLMADGGRFVEMGKTDLRDAGQVVAEYPKVGRYRAFDLVPDAGPVRIGEMLAELRKLFTDGVLHPAPVRTWPLTHAREALRFLSQARHVGKVVLRPPTTLDPEGTVLVTGGTGTLGGLLAEHLVRTGRTRHLLLTGRRGPDAPGAEELADRLAGLGARVRVVAADMTDPRAVAAVVGGVDPAHPLTGVVHAAGVVDDGTLEALSPERLERVWRPKAAAAYHLHQATAHLPLAMFVVFSSAAGTLGSPGQANYAAANAYCDALAAHRSARGLPGLSVGWGLWAQTSGMTGHLTDADLARMAGTGFRPLAAPHGLALFDAACEQEDAHLVAVDLDLRALPDRSDPALPPLLRALAGGAPARRTAAARQAPGDLADRLAALPGDAQRQVLLDLVRTNAASVLGHADAEAVRADASFKDLGFDSLTVVELRNRLAAATGLRLPASLVFDYPEAGVLADHLRQRLAPDGASAAADPVDPLLGELGRIEAGLAGLDLDEEARGRLARRLSGLLSAVNGPRAAATDGPAEFADVESATDDEIFELIDREL